MSSWTSGSYSSDSELKTSLKTLRARSRQLANDDDYAKKFFRMVRTNVIGSNGIRLQSIAKQDNDEPDEGARVKIEEGFKNWSKKNVCEVTGKYSFKDVQSMVMTSVARDGEILVSLARGIDNGFGFALQLIEADHLDEMYNTTLANGNKVKMGVEIDSWGRPVAYWIFKNHPGDILYGQTYSDRIRIPASDMLHIYMPVRVSQNRGVPWMHTAMARLKMLGGYEESELVAARLASAKNGFYYWEKDSEGSGEYIGEPSLSFSQ